MSLAPITHDTLSHPRLRHGFFTREGGVSEGIFRSLNVGLGSSDAPEHVAANRGRIIRHLEVHGLRTCYQIHSALVVTIDSDGPYERTEADAMVTNQPGIALGILTADCAPVLFADAQGGVIGAAHAGWKGALGGVLKNTVDAMERLGASRTRIQAVIGPCIGPESYEVGDEFLEHFGPGNTAFFTPGRPGHAFFDLPGYVQNRLEKLGISAMWCGYDTLPDEARFFSYRRKTLRAEPDYGRQLSAIALME